MKKREFITNVVEDPNATKKVILRGIGLGVVLTVVVSFLIWLGCVIGSYVWSYKLAEDEFKAQVAELYKQNQYIYDQTVFLTTAVQVVAENAVLSQQKPSYSELVSHTIQIFNIEDEAEMKGATGTGTVVKRANGLDYILTNAHVVSGAAKGNKIIAIVSLERRIFATATVVAVSTNEAVDLALITVPSLENKEPITGLGFVEPQDNVYSVGFYLSKQYIYTEGTVAQISQDVTIANLPCAPGCSGSGVFDRMGRLVAVVFAGSVVAGEGFAGFDTAKTIMIPSHAVKFFLAQNGIEFNG